MEFLFFIAGLVAIFGGMVGLASLPRGTFSGCLVSLVLLGIGIGGMILINMYVPNFQPWPTGFFLLIIAVFGLAIGVRAMH